MLDVVAFNWFKIEILLGRSRVKLKWTQIFVFIKCCKKINQMSDSRIRHRGREWPMIFKLKWLQLNRIDFIFISTKLTCYYKCYLNGIFSSNFIDFIFIFWPRWIICWLLIVFKCNLLYYYFFCVELSCSAKVSHCHDSRV